MKKGIVIYAIGHENYYRMAENLAASLVVNGTKEAEIAICIICDDPTKIIYPDLFDDCILISPEKFTVDKKIIFNHATVLVYDLSPYSTTVKLDADMIWINGRNPANLFDELKDVDITFMNRGHGWNMGNSVWTDEEDVKKFYKFTGEELLYKIFGEFLYFKKTTANKKYFDKVKAIYKKPGVKCTAFANGTMTDELAFQIACMEQSVYPHKDNYTPIYNKYLGYSHLNRKYSYELDGYYGYSIGGNVSVDFAKQQYNNLAKHYFATLGLSNPYQVVDKRTFLPERKKL